MNARNWASRGHEFSGWWNHSTLCYWPSYDQCGHWSWWKIATLNIVHRILKLNVRRCLSRTHGHDIWSWPISVFLPVHPLALTIWFETLRRRAGNDLLPPMCKFRFSSSCTGLPACILYVDRVLSKVKFSITEQAAWRLTNIWSICCSLVLQLQHRRPNLVCYPISFDRCWLKISIPGVLLY